VTARRLWWAALIAAAVALVATGAPSWVALAAGLVIALVGKQGAPPKPLVTYSLQLGVVALGAAMNLDDVLHTGADGALITAASLAIAIGLGLGLGRLLRIGGDTPLLVSVGTAICGGSAIAAVASVIRPKDEELSISLALVFVLNAIALVAFPPIGHALGLSEPVFGRWAALAIHDTSSVVGAGLAYGSTALAIATTTKLARALWIVPLTVAVAIMRGRSRGGSLRGVKWPWFIGGYLALAALVTWVPAIAAHAGVIAIAGRRALLVALLLIGASLSPAALAKLGPRPLALALVLWLAIAAAALPLASWVG